jgi:excisionase family DNA binding protein
VNEGVAARTKLLKPEEVADILSVPVGWVRANAREGTLPAIKLGRYWRFSPSAIDAFIAGR